MLDSAGLPGLEVWVPKGPRTDDDSLAVLKVV